MTSWFGKYSKGVEARRKLAKLGKEYLRPVYSWNLPALMTRRPVPGFPHPFRTCPKSGECAKWCYARAGRFIFKNVTRKHHRCLALTRHPDFERILIRELTGNKPRKFCRIHSSGEFYDLPYLRRWLSIIENMKAHTTFWTYTKQVKMFKALAGQLPANLNVIFSEGGMEDHLIDRATDRHSRVFPAGTTRREVEATGYAWCVDDDLYPICIDHVRKVGLVAHGGNKKALVAVTGPKSNPAGHERTTCPSCDEHVNLEHGQCPKCGAWVTTAAAKTPGRCARCGRLLRRLLDAHGKCVGTACEKCGTAGRANPPESPFHPGAKAISDIEY